MSGASTLVTLDGTLSDGSAKFTDLRSITIHEVIGSELEIGGRIAPDEAAAANELWFFGPKADFERLNDRRLLFARDDGTTEELVVTTGLAENGHQKVLLKEFKSGLSPDDFPIIGEPRVTVFGNLSNAVQGKIEREAILGNGDARQAFQTFKLPKSPLTYLVDSDESPPESPRLDVYVDDRKWRRVSTFFGYREHDEIYVVREDHNGDSWLQFGDGKTGRRLPSGVDNIVARYRTGIGAFGDVKQDTKVQPLGRVDNLVGIEMPGGASGGNPPESGDCAREAAPGKVQSLGRMVSLRDFELETLAVPGVAKVRAAWDLVNGVPGLMMTVLMDTGRSDEIDAVRKTIAQYSRSRGADRFPIVVRKGTRRWVGVVADVAYDATYRKQDVIDEIAEALGVGGISEKRTKDSRDLFRLLQRRFGESERASRVEGTIQNVDAVVWVKVRSFCLLQDSGDPEVLPMPESPTFTRVLPCTPDTVLALHRGHLQINPVSVMRDEGC